MERRRQLEETTGLLTKRACARRLPLVHGRDHRIQPRKERAKTETQTIDG